MGLDDLLKDPNTAWWTGFVSTGILYTLYFTALRYGRRIYNHMFKDD